MTIAPDKLAEILRDAAKREILPRFRKLDEGMVRTKSSAIDLVTEADVGAERVITAALKQAAPDALVVGEEAVAADASLLDRALDAPFVIYVDPVDGTANFVGGLPLYAVMASVVVNGETVAGVIYDPMGDDWLMAEIGSGAWLKFPDGRAIPQRFSDPAPLNDMIGTASPFYMQPAARAKVLANFNKLRMVASYRCAGHEYRLAAGGNIHFLMFHKLMPWDHLAGSLIMQEAGAFVARFDGEPYLPAHRDGGLLIAPDQDSWTELRQQVFVDA
ncbi:inositol monophosphatase [Devosia pacifica]|uniref:Inositol monophosphatase n=1 Tax=Devosia pacifica TaxID=1335967 RepID=A0A918VPC8_9HYPH|nr:inositol monophosphatase [Devosia pacifica]GHA14389.1 inositol monophosphatase [Devosia pacifica]